MKVARITGGEYHYAGTAKQLRSAYQKLGPTLQVQKREAELSGGWLCCGGDCGFGGGAFGGLVSASCMKRVPQRSADVNAEFRRELTATELVTAPSLILAFETFWDSFVQTMIQIQGCEFQLRGS